MSSCPPTSSQTPRRVRDERASRTSAPAPTELTSEQLDLTLLIAARGEIDLATSPQLERAVGAALSGKPGHVVLDLCEVSFLDSCGLAVLLGAHRHAQRSGIVLRIACDVPSTLRVLELTGLDRELDVRPSVREALET